ncbi:uncharacterized protein LODBEIA_P38280 [Lodderomyces beijingensis]|uniref:UDP-N-acetylglucosamine transferase subunit ALG14 n=1 Tax=Lodderomyces beijingensis TaxID=1775926 RepID=A0ABP0ZNY8_9ASCO
MVLVNLETYFCTLVVLISIPILVLLLRIIHTLPSLHLPPSIRTQPHGKPLSQLPDGSRRIAIFLGSGGHTGEMIKMISKLSLARLDRTWIISNGDSSSLQQAKFIESQVYRAHQGGTNVMYKRIPRARNVGQSYFKSVFTTVYSFAVSSITLLFNRPDILLLNGPGTCVPIAYIYFVYKVLGLSSTRIIYIESLARVDKLSLSGRLILPIADRFIVQWDQLYQQYNRAEYYGILI